MKSRWEALADQLDVERPGAGVDELTSLRDGIERMDEEERRRWCHVV